VRDSILVNCPHPLKGFVQSGGQLHRAQRGHQGIKGGLASTVTCLLNFAEDLQGGQLSFLLKDVAYHFPEALNDAWSSDSALPSLAGVIEMLN
jgi:hypothetical protein